ncbi:CLUMA_CG018819, isoform A [Clunio marinus]|uniref:CLUMA_CG018819, isoform A n=1 Tax=Clunio marinus TaxID=568069 RepID=A0A1J1J070_9DIPT|nr:CLUMA_CG018819, isoform A [Clunio marinus]
MSKNEQTYNKINSCLFHHHFHGALKINTRKKNHDLEISKFELKRERKFLPVSGTDGIEIVPGNRFERNPRILVTTFWGDPLAAPKSDPPNLVNNADGEDSPVVLFELSSCDATT